jgi:hypothetical protein
VATSKTCRDDAQHVVGTARDRFDQHFEREIAPLRRRCLSAALIDDPTVGDLLECLDDGAYVLDEDDRLTLGELVDGTPRGPLVVEVLSSMGLPLGNPFDAAAADSLLLGVTLSHLLATIDGGLNLGEELSQLVDRK